MKFSALLLAVAVLVLSASVYAQDTTKIVLPFQRATAEQTEKSLKKALESKSEGLQLSAALTVREMKAMMPQRGFGSLVIPLMAIVKNNKTDPSVRMIAAMALHDLRDARGDYAISQLAQNCDQTALKQMCQWLTYYVNKENKPEYATHEPDSLKAE